MSWKENSILMVLEMTKSPKADIARRFLVSLAFGVESRWPDGIFGHGILGEHRQPDFP